MDTPPGLPAWESWPRGEGGQCRHLQQHCSLADALRHGAADHTVQEESTSSIRTPGEVGDPQELPCRGERGGGGSEQ